MQSSPNLKYCCLGTFMEIVRKPTENLGLETAEYDVGVLIIAPDGEFIS
jgi:hypothetical protein